MIDMKYTTNPSYYGILMFLSSIDIPIPVCGQILCVVSEFVIVVEDLGIYPSHYQKLKDPILCLSRTYMSVNIDQLNLSLSRLS